jgi:hypothetical protein
MMFRTLFRSPHHPAIARGAAPDADESRLASALAEARDRAAADADLALTAERAEAQRAAIAARLRAAHAGADDRRVLTFPPREVLGLSGPELAEVEAILPARRATRSPRPALGWILTAAAAGLVVGVGTGNGVYDELPGTPSAPSTFAAAPAAPAPASADTDETILADVEVALAGHGVDELRPLDALTPTVSMVAGR